MQQLTVHWEHCASLKFEDLRALELGSSEVGNRLPMRAVQDTGRAILTA